MLTDLIQTVHLRGMLCVDRPHSDSSPQRHVVLTDLIQTVHLRGMLCVDRPHSDSSPQRHVVC